ncbi:bifunctional diguanylate cyclase/phosphodiesterase [Amaricoccus sp.]|uniref:putative bifunctional diguanylate cyclase/phosphodiesterase n=1 Tax=Amaricoccus sp. TaxID=1872485 RepID=UPI001B47F43E|nr:bifunctional diguanylate cyclase/phosphodiesterase [Amaricoccus sp.]MBP7242579.1 bifunctional diguanylate cyclase/phosphodiesterase [Amaricoccus sp.]
MSELDPSLADPEKVAIRAAAAIVAGALALTLAGGVLVDLVGQRPIRLETLASTAAAEAAILREIAGDLDRMAEAAPGPEREAARRGLDWNLGRVATTEVRLAELAGPDDRLLAVSAAAVRDFAASAADIAPSAAATQAALVDDRLAPQLERLGQRYAAETARAHDHARFVRRAVLLAQTLGLLGLAAALVLPARRRIAAWLRANREAEREARHRLLHDPVTRLPNATYLQAHLARLAAAAERSEKQTAVLRLDLDRFKSIRETLGPRVADEIVRIAARRIRLALRVGDFAAHLGQDDFVLVASDLDDAAAAAAIAHRVQSVLAKPFSLQGGARRIGCSIGVAMLADDLPEAERALANADIALAEAQDAAPGAIRYFRESLRIETQRREALFAQLLAGLERGELGPFYQPQIDVATGALAGFEALVRWRHPERGLLAPGEFLEFAEAAGLTERIGEVVLGQALSALTAWDAAGLEVPRVGINFAMAQLRDPRLIEKIKWEVERHDIDPSRIAIEVLETVLIKSDEDLMVRNLRGLASAGFQIELDDFGTGHASIQNLRRLNVHRIKIDRSFVHGIEASEEQRTLTASMIAMARALGIGTLAEGVETAEGLATLATLGCDQAQGYHIARPMGLADTFDWLDRFQGRASGERAAAGPDSRPSIVDPNKP